MQRQQRNCVYDKCTGKKTQHSGMLLLCFESLCERPLGQLCVDTTSLGDTHKAHIGPPKWVLTHLCDCVCVTSNLSRV